MNFNKSFILGRLTADPRMGENPNGKIANFSVATNKVWTDKRGVKQEDSQFHNIVVFGKQAEVVERYCKKGTLIFVEGKLQTRQWEDKGGQPRQTTEIVAETIQFQS